MTFHSAHVRVVITCRWYQKYGLFYADELQDALVGRRVLELLSLPRFESQMILEGGSLHSDGQGYDSTWFSKYYIKHMKRRS